MLVFSSPRLFQQLPDTMKMAQLFRDVLEPLLDAVHLGWSYGDRVLLWLAPCFKGDLERFYKEDSTSLEGLFDPTGLEHMDRDFSTLLYGKIKEIKSRYHIDVVSFLSPESCFVLD